jgi:hypothetical protein
MPNRGLAASTSLSRRQKGQEKKFQVLSAQPIEKARLGRENPRKSNPYKKRFHAEMATVQENPNLADQTERRARRREGAEPAPAKGKVL